MSHLRIAFLCSEFPPEPHGGIGAFVHDMAHALAARGHHVWVFGYGEKSDERSEGRLTVIRWHRPRIPGLKRISGLWQRMRLARRAGSLARLYRWDIVEVPDWQGEGMAFRDYLRPSTTLVARLHGGGSALAVLRKGSPSRLLHFYESRTILSANHRLAVSEFLEEATRTAIPQLPPCDAIMPNFVDTDLFKPQGGNAQRTSVLYAGRVNKLKGGELLIETFREILRLTPNTCIDVVGSILDQDMDETLRSLPNVTLHGAVSRSKMPGYYRKAACVILPSRAEAFGLVALEAMACGCVPVVLDDSGPAEFIRHGETGIVVQGASASGVAKAALDLLQSPDERDRLATAGVRDVQEGYSLESAVARNERFYESVTSAMAEGFQP